MANDKKFSWKGWVSLFTFLSFVIDTVSGIILYIAPPGRIANWTNWKVWGLTKEEWGAVHTIFGYVLLIIICFHIYYNWKIFWNYIWSKMRKAFNLKREMTAAIILSIVVFMGTLWDIPPFSSTMDLGTAIKDSWEENKADVPEAHAELKTLEEFAATINVPLDQIQQTLKDKGYQFSGASETMAEIAERNNTSPNALFDAIKTGGAQPEVQKSIKGSGMGQKSIEQVCQEMGIPLDEALNRLKVKGIDAKANDRLKEIGSKNELTPMDVYNIISGQ